MAGAQIIQEIINYQYFLIFPIVIIEGPIIMVISGLLAAKGLINLYIVFLVLVAGDLTGDSLYYALGRWGRNGAIDKWGKYVGLSSARVKKVEEHFDNHSGKTMMIGKIAHGVGTVFLAAAGAVKMPFRKFLFYNILGTIPKVFVLLLIGYYFGQAYIMIGQYFDYFALGAIILALLFLILYVLMKKIKKNEDDIIN